MNKKMKADVAVNSAKKQKMRLELYFVKMRKKKKDIDKEK